MQVVHGRSRQSRKAHGASSGVGALRLPARPPRRTVGRPPGSRRWLRMSRPWSLAASISFGVSGPPRSCLQVRSRGFVLEREKHRQGVDALGEILAGGLAEVLLGPDHVEDVVADLEDHPECLSEPRESLDLRRRSRREVIAPTRHAVAMSADVLPAIASK